MCRGRLHSLAGLGDLRGLRGHSLRREVLVIEFIPYPKTPRLFRQVYKVLLENDEVPKGLVNA